MASSKPLKTIAESVLAGKKLAKAGAAVDTLNEPQLQGTLSALSDLDEYSVAAGKVDAEAPVERVAEEVMQARETAAEAARVEGITTSRSVDLDLQAVTDEEFKGRLPQLVDDGYAKSATETGRFEDNQPNPFDAGTKHKERYARWDLDTEPYNEMVWANKEQFDWASEGAYTRGDIFGSKTANPDAPVVFFRMDIKRDPRSDLTPIQFDPDANEFGMHVGSKQAGSDIVSPEVSQRNRTRMKDLTRMFDTIEEEVAAKGGKINEIWADALTEVRTNLFLRHGEERFAEPTKELLDDIVDEFISELNVASKDLQIEGLQESKNLAAFKSRLRSIMRVSMDPVQHPLVTNVKKGLHVQDLLNNDAVGIANDLFGRGIFDDNELQAIISAGSNAQSNNGLRKLLRDEGYDHLVYVNAGEDKGAISIVLFDDANYENLYRPKINRRGGNNGHNAAVGALLAPLVALGGGNAVLQRQK